MHRAVGEFGNAHEERRTPLFARPPADVSALDQADHAGIDERLHHLIEPREIEAPFVVLQLIWARSSGETNIMFW